MSTVDPQAIEMERQRLGRRLEEVQRLSESDAAPPAFYGDLLRLLLESLSASAGAVWGRTAQGNLQILFQINLRDVGLEKTEEAKMQHYELLRRAFFEPKPIHLLPHSGAGAAEAGGPAPSNPTDFALLLVPIMLNGQVVGLIEVWQAPGRPREAVNGFLKYMGLMAEHAARYQRNQMLGQMVGQQQLWTQLEAFSRQVHGSLNPIEVAYLVANEGRRLIACDRVSVAVRQGRKTAIEAISGADVVEKRSNVVLLQRRLSDRVLKWGEKLVFTGTKDDSLPPKVLAALDAYLAESASKLLVVQPLKDDREGESKKPSRAALVMECFDPPAEPQQLIARLDVVARHATPALYNAVEHRRIPMRFIWMPLAKVQEGIGGKAKAITLGVAVGLALLLGFLCFVPWPLKMDANGQLVPQVRRYVYLPGQGKIEDFDIKPGDRVESDRRLATAYDPELRERLVNLQVEIDSLQKEADQAAKAANEAKAAIGDKVAQQGTADIKRGQAQAKAKLLEQIRVNNNCDRQRDGYFFLKSPTFAPEETSLVSREEWTVLNSGFIEEMRDRTMKPSDPVLRLGAKDGPWEIELKIPQKHIGQVKYAFSHLKRDELDVDFLLRTDPTRTFRGKLSLNRIAGEANPNRDDNNESDPVVIAYVRIDEEGIDPAYRVPPELLVTGTEVHAKIRCGSHASGYSLFYGVWEFLYEKVVFFF